MDAPLAASPNLVDQWRLGSSAESQQTKFAKNLTIRVIRIWVANCVRSSLPWPYAPRSITSWGQASWSEQHAAGKPFFLYLPFSMGHVSNLPTKEFAGKSRIGNFGDKIMGRRFTTSAKSQSKMFKKNCNCLWRSRSSFSAKRIGHTIGRGGPRRQWSC